MFDLWVVVCLMVIVCGVEWVFLVVEEELSLFVEYIG